jgi:hypothetical protein
LDERSKSPFKEILLLNNNITEGEFIAKSCERAMISLMLLRLVVDDHHHGVCAKKNHVE